MWIRGLIRGCVFDFHYRNSLPFPRTPLTMPLFFLSKPTAFCAPCPSKTRSHIPRRPSLTPLINRFCSRAALRASKDNCQGSHTGQAEAVVCCLTFAHQICSPVHIRWSLICTSSLSNGVHRGGHIQPGAAIPRCKAPPRAAAARCFTINTLSCSKLKLSSCSARWS